MSFWYNCIIYKMTKTPEGLERVKGVEPSTSTLAISRYLRYRATLRQYTHHFLQRIYRPGNWPYLIFHTIVAFSTLKNIDNFAGGGMNTKPILFYISAIQVRILSLRHINNACKWLVSSLSLYLINGIYPLYTLFVTAKYSSKCEVYS